jgi:hypothetical protein
MQPAGSVGNFRVERGELGLYERGRFAAADFRAGFAVAFRLDGAGVFF